MVVTATGLTQQVSASLKNNEPAAVPLCPDSEPVAVLAEHFQAAGYDAETASQFTARVIFRIAGVEQPEIDWSEVGYAHDPQVIPMLDPDSEPVVLFAEIFEQSGWDPISATEIASRIFSRVAEHAADWDHEAVLSGDLYIFYRAPIVYRDNAGNKKRRTVLIRAVCWEELLLQCRDVDPCHPLHVWYTLTPTQSCPAISPNWGACT